MTTIERIRELCKQNGISVTVLEKELGYGNGSLTKASTNSIKADRLLSIAKYFNVSMEFLMGEDDPEQYYLNKDAADYADFLLSNPEYRVLFDASRKVKAEDLKKAVQALGLFSEEEE